MAAAASASALRPPVIALPSSWEPIDTANGNKVFVLLDKVKHAKELTAVESHWTKTGGSGTIIAVHRVQNEAQYRRFHKAGMALNESSEPAQLKSIVYHGTCRNSPWLICESDDGFDPCKGRMAPGSASMLRAEHAEVLAAVRSSQSGFQRLF